MTLLFLYSSLNMPQHRNPKRSSTDSRKDLGRFVQEFRRRIPRACSACRRNHTKYKVYVRSGRYGECHLRGSTYDIRVTKSEWDRLKFERERLIREIEASRRAQEAAAAAQEEARRKIDAAFRDELKLR